MNRLLIFIFSVSICITNLVLFTKAKEAYCLGLKLITIDSSCYDFTRDSINILLTATSIIVATIAASFAYKKWREEKNRAAVQNASNLSVWWGTKWEDRVIDIIFHGDTAPTKIHTTEEKWGICINNTSGSPFFNIAIIFKIDKQNLRKNYRSFGKLIYENKFSNIRHRDFTNNPPDNFNPKSGEIVDALYLDAIPPGLFVIDLRLAECTRHEQCIYKLVEWDSALPMIENYSPLTRAIGYSIDHIFFKDYNNQHWHINFTKTDNNPIIQNIDYNKIKDLNITLSRVDDKYYDLDSNYNSRTLNHYHSMFNKTGIPLSE